MSEPYWQTGEVPDVIEVGRQRFKYYKAAQVLEISSLMEDETGTKEIRRQTLSAHKLNKDEALRDMLLNFLEDCGAIQTVSES